MIILDAVTLTVVPDYGLLFDKQMTRGIGMAACDYEFNDTQFGSDYCTKEVGHTGDHYDKDSGHSYPNASEGRTSRVTCGYEFNETQFGWDSCTKNAGHDGDHHDKDSGHSCRNFG